MLPVPFFSLGLFDNVLVTRYQHVIFPAIDGDLRMGEICKLTEEVHEFVIAIIYLTLTLIKSSIIPFSSTNIYVILVDIVMKRKVNEDNKTIVYSFFLTFERNSILEIIRSDYLMKPKTNRAKVLNIDDIILRLVETPNTPEKNCVIKEGEVQGLCAMAKQIMLDQPMLLELEAPVQICGDIHGQFSDLITIFKIFGSPEHKNYLFLGDYVDRGKQSLECILLLLAYKIRYPNKFFMLRGNHQSMELNKLYGFFDQCKRRLTIRAWKVITDTFNCLPVAAVVGGRIFCVHGGLSPQIKTLDMLNTIRRPVQILDNRIITDILWADPKPSIDGWNQNYERGVSYYYGTNVVDFFLKRNDFDLICRSHQVVEEGYEFAFDRKLITIFSSPNYCGEFQNLAAVLKVASDLTCRIEQFEGAPIQTKKRGRSVTPIRGGVNNWKENSSPRKSREPSLSPRKERNSQEISNVKQRKATKIMSNFLAKNSAPQPGELRQTSVN